MRPTLTILILLFLVSAGTCEIPRVRTDQSKSADIRLNPAKTLNDHFPFEVPSDVASWHARAEKLRHRILVATGLWPMPNKTPLNAVIHGKSVRDGFSVEKVYFESLPGHYVTGLLFRPTDQEQAKRPGVLCPHGHGGRMQSHSDAELASQLKQGAEHFAESGRTPKIARCVQLARMGCVSFIFDMLGYEDSLQITYEIAHRHQNARPEELDNDKSEWIFFSPEADLRCQSIMGLQTWNAIRALDFLESLPDVDPNRLAVTGGSGGGTQSILLGAIDQRIKVSFPNGMVSTSMQGGCYCENCNFLRVDSGNVELAALFAPRPQAMTAADDWTKEMMQDGYPQLQWLYAMLGDQNDVYCRPMLHFKHNYNYVTRATMYQWMNKHLDLGLDDPVIEQDFIALTDQESSVWNQEHPAPTEVGIDHERRVCNWLDTQSQAILGSLETNSKESFQKYKQLHGEAWEVIFDQGLPRATQWTELGSTKINSVQLTRALVSCAERGTEIPTLVVQNQHAQEAAIVWTTQVGKASAFENDGRPSAALQELLDQNMTVILPDLIGQGEWAGKSQKATLPRMVDDNRSYSAFTYGYNRTLSAERCSDILTVIAAVQTHLLGDKATSPLALLGGEGSAAWSVPAAAIAGSTLSHATLITNGFRFGDIRDYKDEYFVPGSVKYGDVPSLLALRAPHATTIIGETESLPVVVNAYQASGSEQRAQFVDSINYQTLLKP